MELQKLFVTLGLKMSEYQQGLSGAAQQASGFGDHVQNVFNRLGQVAKLAMAGVGVAVAAGFGLAVRSSIQVNAQLETTRLQFETLMGDADLASEHVAGLFKFAEKTPFETGPIIEASLKLQTFGGEALNTMANITLLGDAAAATNAPIDELGFWVGRLYANLQAGQPFGEAAMRLQELAVMSPQARTEMQRLQESGASAQEVFAYFQKDLERFSGAMEKQASTWRGMASTIKDQIQLMVAGAMEPFFEAGKEGMGELIKLLNDPNILKGIKSLGAELGKVAEGFSELAGSAIRFFAALGQESANVEMMEQLGLSLQEIRDLTYEMQEQEGVGFFMTTEEELAVQIAINEALQERYGTELQLIELASTARSEWEDWGGERQATETREFNAALADQLGFWDAVTVGTQGASAATATYATDMTIWSENAGIAQHQAEQFGQAIGFSADESRDAALALQEFSAAFQEVVGDYVEALPGADEPLVSPAGFVTTLTGGLDAEHLALLTTYREEVASLEEAVYTLQTGVGTYGMTQEEVNSKIVEAQGEIAHYQALIEPLAAQTGVLSQSQVGLKVNVDGVKQAIFDQLVEMGAAPEVITAYGVAIGVMTREQAEAALMAATVKSKIEDLALALKEGTLAPQEAIDDLNLFIDKLENGMIPAAETAATVVPERIVELKERVAEEALYSGRALGEGFQTGIDETQPDTVEKARGMAEEVISETKSTYGIESPSTVFAGIARDVVAGMETGLEEKRAGLITKAKSIGTALIDGVIAGIDEAKERLRGILQGVADLIPDWLASFLGIGSPAEEVIFVGEAIVDGIIFGIEAESSYAESAAHELASNLVAYFQTALDEGDHLNEFLDRLPDEMQPNVILISALMNSGASYVMDYFQMVISEGDALNDSLTYFPEELRPAVQEIGEVIAEGLENVGEYFVGLEQTLLNVEQLLDWGGQFDRLSKGFVKRFDDQILQPMEDQMAGFTEQIAAAAPIFDDLFVATFKDDWTINTLDQLVRAQALLNTRIRDYQARGVPESAYRYELQSLEVVNEAIDAFKIRNDINSEYIRQQERLYELEKARADLDYLETQFGLLKLIQDNIDLFPFPSGAFGEFTWGLNADPAELADLMVDVMERLVFRTQQELNQYNQPPTTWDRSSANPETAVGGSTMNVNTQNIHGGQHIYVTVEDASALERLSFLSR